MIEIDPTAGAYGLFQIVFANMQYELSVALLALRSKHDPCFTFEDVPWEFEKLLRELKRELKCPHWTEHDSISEIRRMCRAAADLSPWRNERIHARVKQVDGGLALFDWKTGKPLAITRTDCEKRISKAIRVVSTLPTHVSYVVKEFDARKARDVFKECLQRDSA